MEADEGKRHEEHARYEKNATMETYEGKPGPGADRMTKPDADFTKTGAIRLLPLDTTSFFLPFGRPVIDYIRGAAGRDNGLGRLAAREAFDFPFEIGWRQSTVERLVPDGLEPEQEQKQAAAAVEVEPEAAGFLSAAPGLTPRGAPSGQEVQRGRLEISGPRVVLPGVDALPLRPRITLAPPPAKLAKSPVAPSPSKTSPAAKSARPAPIAAASPAAGKVVPAAKAPAESPKPPAPEPARPAAAEPTKKPANVIEMERKPSWSPAEKSWNDKTPPEVHTEKVDANPAADKAAGDKVPPVTAARTGEAAGKPAEPTAKVEIPKPLSEPAASEKKPAITAEPPAKPASPRLAIIPAKPVPPAAPAAPAAQARPGTPQPAAAQPAALQTGTAQPKPREPRPQESKHAASAQPASAQQPSAQTHPTMNQDSDHTGSPRTEPAQEESADVRVPSFGGAGLLSGSGAEGEQGFLARIPLAVKIGVVAVALGLGGYFLVDGVSSSTPAKGRPAPASATVTGGEGWSTKDASDTVGVRRGRQMQFYDASASMADYKFEFVGTVETKALGWFFRARDTRNYYGMKLEFVRPGSALLTHFAVVDGRESSFNQRPLAINASPGAPIPVQLEAAGARFTVAVQGQTVEVWTDNRLSRGAVGLMNERDEFGRAGNVRFSGADAR